MVGCGNNALFASEQVLSCEGVVQVRGRRRQPPYLRVHTEAKVVARRESKVKLVTSRLMSGHKVNLEMADGDR